ncbi:hypothetical protein [Methylobacterium sp.]|uniref:hypothetical protein n=1 Tax=Methylobacterium sp. TaxID=409 RepID=UPI00339016F4
MAARQQDREEVGQRAALQDDPALRVQFAELEFRIEQEGAGGRPVAQAQGDLRAAAVAGRVASSIGRHDGEAAGKRDRPQLPVEDPPDQGRHGKASHASRPSLPPARHRRA